MSFEPLVYRYNADPIMELPGQCIFIGQTLIGCRHLNMCEEVLRKKCITRTKIYVGIWPGVCITSSQVDIMLYVCIHVCICVRACARMYVCMYAVRG